jgi:hypothetical protein
MKFTTVCVFMLIAKAPAIAPAVAPMQHSALLAVRPRFERSSFAHPDVSRCIC